MSQRTQRIQTNHLKSGLALLLNRQICAAQPKGAKNLATVESPIQGKAQGESTEAIQGKIIEFAWWMQKEGYAESTIYYYGCILKLLMKRGVNILNPDAVKEYLGKANLKESRKWLICQTYTTFLKFMGFSWTAPNYQHSNKIPFLPTEQEIDQLIAGCGKKVAAALQIAKETAMRLGEIGKLKITDIDFERNIIILNEPEKHCNARIFKISPKLVAMLRALPKLEGEHLFRAKDLGILLSQQRKRIVRKLQNPRLAKISFHTLRHWKATELYHQTKDILYVMKFLGHKNIQSTLIYIDLERIYHKEQTDQFYCKAAKTPQEVQELIEAGFEFVCQLNDALFFRKRK
ncbi:MAG: site-specific integrase [Candidatus Bathyarchaeia archaeon]